MSKEITLNASLTYSDSELSQFILSVPTNLQKDIATKKFVYNKMNVLITEVAIPLGNLTTLGYYIFVNRDPTNFVELRVGTAGSKFAKLDAVNGFAMGKFGSDVTAPYAIANTGPCQMEYLILAV